MKKMLNIILSVVVFAILIAVAAGWLISRFNAPDLSLESEGKQGKNYRVYNINIEGDILYYDEYIFEHNTANGYGVVPISLTIPVEDGQGNKTDETYYTYCLISREVNDHYRNNDKYSWNNNSNIKAKGVVHQVIIRDKAYETMKKWCADNGIDESRLLQYGFL